VTGVLRERTVDGLPAVALIGPEAGGLEATFVPAAGMVGYSLRHRGEEVLGRRRGLRAYLTERVTMGIPLLHPWANRLAATRFSIGGREVDLDSVSPPLRVDSQGLPMHGLLAGARWEVRGRHSSADGGVLEAGFDFGADRELMAAFPFAHRLGFEATLRATTLTIATTVQASGSAAVPIAFGYHPYLRLPGVRRRDWEIEVPVGEQLLLDSRGLPTGKREATSVPGGPLGSRTFDDAYTAPAGGGPFALTGGGRRIEVSFLDGYPYAQVYAPSDDDVVAFEPMTAPTNALVAGGPDLRLLVPGDCHRATFSITVRDC
jgi:aldose 1-epimerase